MGLAVLWAATLASALAAGPMVAPAQEPPLVATPQAEQPERQPPAGSGTAAPAPPASAQPNDRAGAGMGVASRQKRFGDWSTNRLQGAEQTICFAVSKGRATARGAARGDANEGSLVYVSTWPQGGVKAEVSVRAKPPFRAGVPVRLTIGTEIFVLSAREGQAYVDHPIAELKLLEAMKKGGQMTLVGEADGGVAIGETFSLNGLGAALVHVTQGCP